jgi:hypothetical protein
LRQNGWEGADQVMTRCDSAIHCADCGRGLQRVAAVRAVLTTAPIDPDAALNADECSPQRQPGTEQR